ncbi:hypothetical protein KU6B_39750 [Mameliella alba]|nr:hypothetical protein KU6B_39750 [Mameliella alba]
MGEQAISKKARRVEDVRRRILTQVFEPGSYLDEAELAQTHDFSRPPLREALNQLPAENATEAQVMQLKDTQELFRKAIREGDAARNALMNQRFHAIIGEMADNEFLTPSLRRLLIDHTRIGMSFYNPRNCSMAEQRSVAAGQHDQFIALIEQGDVEGATSWVCAGSNFLPGEHIALWRACRVEVDFDKGRRIMSAMMPLMRVLEQGGKFIQCVKHGCEKMGQYAGPPRPPLRPLNKDDRRQMEQVVRVLKRTEAEIEAGPQAEAAG